MVSTPTTGSEVLQVLPVQPNGQPAAIQQQVTTFQVAQAANIGGTASGSFSATSNTVLANITGMACTVVAGATYIIDGYIACTNNATGGLKLAFSATATATLFLMDTWVYNTTTLTAEVNITALASNLVSAAVAATAVFFGGTLIVNAGGTLQLQGAQSVSNATAFTIANGSYLQLTRIA